MQKLLEDEAIDKTENKPKQENSVSLEDFLNSAEKITFFWEDDAIDKSDGKLLLPPTRAVNKVAHALHTKHPRFKQLVFSEKSKNILEQLNFEHPKVPQSMYIFKQPGVGGEFIPHVDCS